MIDKTVDYDVENSRKLLKRAKMRMHCQKNCMRPQVLIDKKWLYLCRTDLISDVATYTAQDASLGLEAIRDIYLQKIVHGARIGGKNDTGYGTFRVIDSFSDG